LRISFSSSDTLRLIDLAKSCDPKEITFILSLNSQISLRFSIPFSLSIIGIISVLSFSFDFKILSIFKSCSLLSVKGRKIPINSSSTTKSKSSLLLILI